MTSGSLKHAFQTWPIFPNKKEQFSKWTSFRWKKKQFQELAEILSEKSSKEKSHTQHFQTPRKNATPWKRIRCLLINKNTWIFSWHVKFQGIFSVRTVFFFPPGRSPIEGSTAAAVVCFSLVSWRTPTRLRSYSFRCKRWGVRDILYLSSLSP